MDRARSTRRRNALTSSSGSSTPWILSSKAVTALKSSGAVWTARSEALQALVDCTKCVQDNDSGRDQLAAQVRTLAPALAKIVSDLRSALVRQSCEAITHLAQSLGSRFTDAACDDVLPVLLRRAGTKKLIMRESAANAATTMLNLGAEGVPRSVALHLCATILDRTAPAPVRAAACTYQGILLRNLCPSLLQLGKELNNSVRAGCSDADEPVRAASRANLRSVRSIDEERYSAIYSALSKKVQTLVDEEPPAVTPKTEELIEQASRTKGLPKLLPSAEPARVPINKKLPRPPANRKVPLPIKAETTDTVITVPPVRASFPVRTPAPFITANAPTRPSYMPRMYVPRRRETLVRKLREKETDTEGDENSKEYAENSNKPMYPRRSVVTSQKPQTLPDKSLPKKIPTQDVLKRLDNRPHPQKRASCMVPSRVQRANTEKPSEIIARRPTTILTPASRPIHTPKPVSASKPCSAPKPARLAPKPTAKLVPVPKHVHVPKPAPSPAERREASKPNADRTRRPVISRPPAGSIASKPSAKPAAKSLPKPKENITKPVVTVRRTATPTSSRPWNLPPPPAAIAKPRHMRQSALPISKMRAEGKDTRRTLQTKQGKARGTGPTVRQRHTSVGLKPPAINKGFPKPRGVIRTGATKPLNTGAKKRIPSKGVPNALKKPTDEGLKSLSPTDVCSNEEQQLPGASFEAIVDTEPAHEKSSSRSFLRLSDFGASTDIIQDSSDAAGAAVATGDSTGVAPARERKHEVTFAKTSNSSTHCSREARERSTSLSSYDRTSVGTTSTSRALATISANTVTPKSKLVADRKTRISFLLGDDSTPKAPLTDESDTVSETAETSQVRFRFQQLEDSMTSQGDCKSPASFASAVSTSRKRSTSNRKETAPLRRVTDFKPRRAVQVDSIE